jgi:NitT/TauT family transport system permease protein
MTLQTLKALKPDTGDVTLRLDMVWAEIALAAIGGMAFYGIIALAERATTFWHPSYRT